MTWDNCISSLSFTFHRASCLCVCSSQDSTSSQQGWTQLPRQEPCLHFVYAYDRYVYAPWLARATMQPYLKIHRGIPGEQWNLRSMNYKYNSRRKAKSPTDTQCVWLDVLWVCVCSYHWSYTLPMSLHTYKEMSQHARAARIKHILHPKKLQRAGLPNIQIHYSITWLHRFTSATQTEAIWEASSSLQAWSVKLNHCQL